MIRKARRPFNHSLLTGSLGGLEQVIIRHTDVKPNRRFCSLALYQLAQPGISMSTKGGLAEYIIRAFNVTSSSTEWYRELDECELLQ